MGVNDGAWEELFERHGIAETLERDGFCRISADSIRALREPRLMTKLIMRSTCRGFLPKTGWPYCRYHAGSM